MMTTNPELPLETIKEFVSAAHFNLDRVKTMLAEQPALLNVRYDWGNGDWESAVQAGGHMGNRALTGFLLDAGASLDICVAAMMGMRDQVAAYLEADSSLARTRGPHGIGILFHAAMSGDTAIADLLHQHGGGEMPGHALHGAINFGQRDMVAWLLAHGADKEINAPDYQRKTPLMRAVENGHTEIAALLRQYGAAE
ncbi:MAG: ankyrin repeat domain-containing protein [Anaerolineae bacterium]|nr:ankyrin repeat domain-containing protein [Anaerolineae bacterium]